MSLPKLKLVYFNIEGVAESVRLALVLAKIPFEDERINFQDWPQLQSTMPYGQVPVLYVGDDDIPKTQSGAMLRWVATLNAPEKNLYPAEKLYEIEEAMGLVADFTRAWMPSLYVSMRPQNFGYPEGFQSTDECKEITKALRNKFVETELPKYLKYLADMIDKNGGKFLCGDEPTIADCLAVPQLRGFSRGHIDHVPSDSLDVEPRIVEYIRRFCDLDGIKGRYADGVH
jgi:glutathione S-transferase